MHQEIFHPQCLGLVALVMSRSWFGVAWVMSRQCGGMSGWCLCGFVSAVCQGWHGNAWLMLSDLVGDVSKSVLWWWCLRVALVMYRWRLRLRDVSVVFEWRYSDVSVMLWWYLGPEGRLDDVSVMSRSCRFWLGRCPGNNVIMSLSCLGRVSVVSRSRLGRVSVSSRWCLGLGLVWLEWCLAQCVGMSGWCLCVVSAVCQGWHSNVWLMLYRWCLEICLVMVVSSCCFSDVSVTSQTQGCLGGVWMTLRWCIAGALVMSWSSVGDVWMMSRWCLGLVVFGRCPGNGAVMSLSEWRENNLHLQDGKSKPLSRVLRL